MSQIRLFIAATEARCTALLERMGVLFEDDGFAVATTEIDEEKDRWEVSIYADTGEEKKIRAALAAEPDALMAGLSLETETLPDIDWVSHSLEGLAPVRAGRFVVHGSHDRVRIPPGVLRIEIDAGQAFGTGHHGTTTGCLEMIESVLRRRRIHRALDLGTGSGVLAIAMRKLQPARILATDIDPVAVRVARANLRANCTLPGIRVETATGFQNPAFRENGPFDLVVANILARPLMAMAPAIARHCAPCGEVVLSGILAEQRWKVLAAFNAQGFAHVRTLWREGWVTLLLR